MYVAARSADWNLTEYATVIWGQKPPIPDPSGPQPYLARSPAACMAQLVYTPSVLWCIVILGNTQLLAEIVVQVCKGRVGVHFKLKLDVTIIVNKDEGRLDVKGTKVDPFADFYQVGETDTSL